MVMLSRKAMMGPSGAGESGPWYLAGGINPVHCLAAYQAIGADSYEASLVNLANPGTYDLTAGVAPGWSPVTGWITVGDKYLKTGINPGVNWSYAVRVWGCLVPANTAAFGASNMLLYPRRADGVAYKMPEFLVKSPGMVSGVLGMANNWGYRDGEPDLEGIGTDGSEARELYIMARNNNGSPAGFLGNGAVMGFVVYNTQITPAQMAAVSDALAALAPVDNAVMPLEEPWRTVGSVEDFTLEEHPGVTNPVITIADITDVADMDFVADPFVVEDSGTYYMFVESKPTTNIRVISYLTSANGLAWTYGAKIMDVANTGSNALSYPYVFKVDSEWYMIPDLGMNDATMNEVKLFKATTFPTAWLDAGVLLSTSAYRYCDATPVQWHGRWYLFVGDLSNDALRIFVADGDGLRGPYSEHPASPLYQGSKKSRPGGRPVLRESSIDLFLQDSVSSYGNKMRVFRITTLTPTDYVASELPTSPILEAAGAGWNENGLHHIDRISPDLTIVDGKNADDKWSIGVYRDVVE